jgi:hypothetical protein
MNRKLYFGLTCLMWLVLPLTALQFRQNWDRLPLRMATHFNAANQPNGWMARDEALWSSLAILAVVLTVFTLILILSYRKQEITGLAWVVLGFFYVVVALCWYMFSSTLKYNVSGQPIDFATFGIVFGLALTGVIAAHVGLRRGPRFVPSQLIAQERHAVRAWSVLFIPVIVIEVGALALLPNWGMRLGPGLICIVLLLVLAAVWSGFQYYFTARGVEIRTLGFRLRSVPRERIQQYSVENWRPRGGYGIRGIGSSRAYVWGSRGVRIVTTDGQVFLGHNEPERIVRDLHEMMNAGK